MAAPKTDYTPIVVFVLDFETGGLDCQKSAITQIALHAIRIDTFEKIGSYVSYVYPYDRKEIKGTIPKRKVLKSKFEIEEKTPMEYEEKALIYSAIAMETLYNEGKPIETVAAETLKFIQDSLPEKVAKNKKPILVGQNIDFDKGFFQQLIEYGNISKEMQKILRGKLDFYGNWQPETLDTIHLGQLALSHNPSISSYKLELMCEQLGIELDDAHDADADVAATANVMAVLTQRMRSVGGTIEGGEVMMNKAEKSRKHFKI